MKPTKLDTYPVEHVEGLAARVAELEALATQACEDEAWANERTVLVEFKPVTSGWEASALDGLVGINATAPTIHGALRALREKVHLRHMGRQHVRALRALRALREKMEARP